MQEGGHAVPFAVRTCLSSVGTRFLEKTVDQSQKPKRKRAKRIALQNLDLTGQRFGNLIAQWPIGRRNHRVIWLCLCDCGALHQKETDGLVHQRGLRCRSCAHTSHGKAYSLEYKMWGAARHRAKKKNIPFDIDPFDISIPDRCPLLNIPLVRRKGSGLNAASPSLDRINSTKGYVKGNVWVISGKANVIKNNASIEEVRLLLQNWEKLGL